MTRTPFVANVRVADHSPRATGWPLNPGVFLPACEIEARIARKRRNTVFQLRSDADCVRASVGLNCDLMTSLKFVTLQLV